MSKQVTGACQSTKPCSDKTPNTKTCYFQGFCAYKKELMKVLKGTILLNGHFQRFRVTIYAETKDAARTLGDYLKQKMQQKGWMPNV